MKDWQWWDVVSLGGGFAWQSRAHGQLLHLTQKTKA
jgi:hypothetical protein